MQLALQGNHGKSADSLRIISFGSRVTTLLLLSDSMMNICQDF